MKLHFDRPKGLRLHKRFFGVNVKGMWWSVDTKEWVYEHDERSTLYCSSAQCNSVKAFRRHLRKHPNIRGKATLVSKFCGGYDVHG